MERVAVASSNIKSIGYECGADGLGELEVEFRSGGVYRYLGVPAVTHDDLMLAPSVGAYLHARIKPVYPCERVPPEREGKDGG